MKKIDVVLILLAVGLFWGLFHKIGMGIYLVRLLLGLITMVIMIYWKLAPYKSQLSPRYLAIANRIENILNPIFRAFSRLPKFQFGTHLSMDLAPFIVCSILIILLIII